jgi:hypothetical protein
VTSDYALWDKYLVTSNNKSNKSSNLHFLTSTSSNYKSLIRSTSISRTSDPSADSLLYLQRNFFETFKTMLDVRYSYSRFIPVKEEPTTEGQKAFQLAWAVYQEQMESYKEN